MSTTPRRIIDADAHIIEPPDIWTSRLPSKYADVGPRVELNPATGHHHWRIGDAWLWPVAQLAQAGWPEYPPSAPWDYDDCDPAAFDAKARLERMDEYGIDVQILYPNILGFYASDILELGPEAAELCVRAYNDFQVDWCSADRRRLIPVASIPFWDREASVREMTRCAELGFTSVLFANKFEQIDLPSFVDPHWDPIYAAAQDLDMPVNFHIGFAQKDVRDNITADALLERRANADASRNNAVLRAGNTVMTQCNIIGNLLLSGVCQRFPDVKLVQVETGFGHIPFYLETLDWQYKAQGNTSLPMLPSEYFHRQCYATFWFDQVSLPLLKSYPDNFMFSTDFPHPISLSPGPAAATEMLPTEWVETSFADIDPVLTEKAISGNAKALYHLD